MYLRETFRYFRAPWAMMLFLLGFGALLFVVTDYYLIPAIDAAKHATPSQKRFLVAASWLLLSVVLFILLVGIGLTFRIRRFFFPTNETRERTRTQYVDAWAESARRMKDVDLEDEPEDDE
jgi:hypothetical protein